MKARIAIGLIVLAQALPALAYIGPGSGISLLGGLWAVLVAVVLAVGAVLIWPFRYLIRRLRRKLGGGASATSSAESSEGADPVDAEPPSSRSE
jgi:hypothetical protein